MAYNPFDAEVAAAEAELRTLQSQLASADAQFNAVPALLRQPGSNLHTTFTGQRDVLVAKINDVTERLSIARKKRDNVNKSAADRIAAGENPEDAYKNSSAAAKSREVLSKVINVLLIVAAVAAIVAIVFYIRKLRNK